jgi:hypothetical protein
MPNADDVYAIVPFNLPLSTTAFQNDGVFKAEADDAIISLTLLDVVVYG